MKKFFQIAAWVIVIGGIIVGWQEFTQYSKQKAKSAERAKKEPTRKAILELATKHNAVVNWEEPLNKIEPPIFTMEVEDALLLKDSRPVLFLAGVHDVERKENNYLVRFNAEDGAFSQHIEFALDCSDEQIRKITQQQHKHGYWEKYAVIAEIQKVRKVVFNLEAKGGSEEPEISVDTTEDVFIANGKCIDLLFVGYIESEDN